MVKIITAKEAAKMVPNGASVMFGGFLGCGNPLALVDAIIDNDIQDITLIANDCAFPEIGIGKLVVQKRVKKIIVSHVGTNPAVAAQMNEGTLIADLVPQGTLAERIRSAGAGLGGFLTPTGVGTPIEDGKEVMTIDGRKYLLEMPLKADVALVKAWKADEMGNLIFRRSARNFNPLIAMAAKTVIAEAEEIVPVGALDPDQIHTPAIFVDYLVRA